MRKTLVLATTAALLAGGVAAAAPAPAPAKTMREVITIERTAKSGLAALAMVGRIHVDKTAGFLAMVERGRNGTWLASSSDFGRISGLSQYGHGTEDSLCDAPVVCDLDTEQRTLTFSITVTDDADLKSTPWTGMTKYLAIEGTRLDLQVDAKGFTVKRHTRATFARVSREASDADGINVGGAGVEVFRGAQLAGGPRGSFAALQLPCEFQGVGVVTFTTTQDAFPGTRVCTPQPMSVSAGTWGGSIEPSNPRHGLHMRTADVGTQWTVSGLVTGVSGSRTRLFVLSY